MNSVSEAVRRLPPGRRLLVSAAAVLLGVVLAVQGVQSTFAGSGPSGPASSSFATAPHGSAAFATLLARSGYAVSQRRLALGEGRPVSPGATLFVLGVAVLDDRDLFAVRRFVDDGGRLVVSGRPPTSWINQLVEAELESAPLRGRVAEMVIPTSGARRISIGPGAGFDRRTVPASAEVLAQSADVPVAVRFAVGRGTVVVLSATAPLENLHLATLDNAAFALGLTGDRPVVFAEAPHGFGPRGGIGGLPTRWKWCLGFLLAATLAWMVSRGRRNGPPEQAVRDLPPARREYVDALGVTLAKVRRRHRSAGGSAGQPHDDGASGTPPGSREDTDR